jgi:hypothetical protein
VLLPPPPPPPSDWDDVEGFLLHGALLELDRGFAPMPALAAFSGEDPVAFGNLRPFEPGEVVPALVEVLALLLPLGVDRLALLLPARAWSLRDPIPPVTDEIDLRTPVLVVVRGDGHEQPCATDATVQELLAPAAPEDDWSLGASLAPGSGDDDRLAHALTILLDHRDELRADLGEDTLVQQLGRILLLGHELALAAACTERLTLASTR